MLGRKDIKHKEKYCLACGNKLERKRYKKDNRLEDYGVYKKRKFCSMECMKSWYKNQNNSYGKSWYTKHNQARNLLKKKNCYLCNSDKNLDIHHIDGDYKNNDKSNLVCLCRSCHMKIHKNAKFIAKYKNSFSDMRENKGFSIIIPLGSYNPRGFCNGRIIEKDGICPAICLLKGAEHAITINDEGLTLDEKKEKVCEYVKLRNEGKLMDYDKKNLRIRKLTPRETWRLMGFDDCDFDKARKINSDAQLYRQAGNSIVVNCLEAIFKKLLF